MKKTIYFLSIILLVSSCSSDVSLIENQINEIKPKLVIIDSIHTIESSYSDSSPGSVSQLKNCSIILSELAKANNFILILVAHITKDGVIAGPNLSKFDSEA